ncbi:MAG: zonular occludens toxin domain-containing protein [Desulfotalea sp.]
MSIIGYHGTPGSGKTYEAVKVILDNLQTGRIVYTNIDGFSDPLCKEAIKSVCNISDLAIETQLKVFENGQTAEFWLHVPPRALIVIDEIQNFFNARDWQAQANRDFGEWASTHRKKGFDVICISQRPERIDSSVRSLFQWCYQFRKIDFFGSLVSNSYMVYSYADEDINGPPLSKQKRSYNSDIFKCYKSYSNEDIEELGIQKHTNVLKHPIIYAIPCVLAFTLYMLSQSSFITGDLFGSKKHMEIATNIKPDSKTKTLENGLNQITQENGVARFSNRIPLDKKQ